MNYRFHLIEVYTALHREHARAAEVDKARQHKLEQIWTVMKSSERELANEALFRLITP